MDLECARGCTERTARQLIHLAWVISLQCMATHPTAFSPNRNSMQESERVRHLAEEDRAVALAERDQALASQQAAEQERQEVRDLLGSWAVPALNVPALHVP